MTRKSSFQSDLNAILESEKKICQTKKTALQIATEEISKANSIIVQQNREICQLKDKNNWRSELILKLEKAIQQIEAEREKLQETIEKKSTVEHQPKECAEKLNEIKNMADQIEKKYSKSKRDFLSCGNVIFMSFVCLFPEISDLSTRLQQVVAEKNLNKSTNRYLQISNRIDPF